jgi:hypothetical protein
MDDLGVDEEIILKVLKVALDWINLSHNRDQCRALVSMVINHAGL